MVCLARLGAALALVLDVALPASAQLQGGSIYGTLKDAQGGVLPVQEGEL